MLRRSVHALSAHATSLVFRSASVPLTSSFSVAATTATNAAANAVVSHETLSTADTTSPKFSIVHHKVNENVMTSEDFFAVIKLAGTQFKVTQGDVVIAEKIVDAPVGEILDLKDVLLLGTANHTIVGRPLVEGAVVRARVEEQTLDEKIDVFKKKRRKNYRRWNGFRRQVTVLRITEVVPVPV